MEPLLQQNSSFLQVKKHLQAWILRIDDFPVILAFVGMTD
jgi:hypothetical protein